MKVIKNNYKPLHKNSTDNKPVKVTCHYCKSIFEYDKSDIKHRAEWKPYGPEYEPAYDYVVCPCCGRQIVIKEYDYTDEEIEQKLMYGGF